MFLANGFKHMFLCRTLHVYNHNDRSFDKVTLPQKWEGVQFSSMKLVIPLKALITYHFPTPYHLNPKDIITSSFSTISPQITKT